MQRPNVARASARGLSESALCVGRSRPWTGEVSGHNPPRMKSENLSIRLYLASADRYQRTPTL